MQSLSERQENRTTLLFHQQLQMQFPEFVSETSSRFSSDFYIRQYPRMLNIYTEYFKEKVDKIFIEYGKPLQFPLSFEPFEQYFSGFDFYYLPFDNTPEPTIWGKWEMGNNGEIVIFFANNCPEVRQRFSIAHELIHVYQRLDDHFKMDLMKVPDENMREKIYERLANKIGAYYLVPEPMLRETWKQNPSIAFQATLYQVSEDTMRICLEDYGLIAKNMLNQY